MHFLENYLVSVINLWIVRASSCELMELILAN